MIDRGHEAADANARAWEAVLDRLERDVAVTEQLARTTEGTVVAPQPAPWEPPLLDGPLPDHLLHRARDLHRRQTEARSLLSGAMAANRASADRLATRPTTGAGPASAYVDVSA
ncbi:MAG TPA: hypothetical protein VFN19_01100 [Candidatus Nanopelagicales bacterium]|nr:hypothetical protein [Candidatus Nanopelagicales bacterium]